MGSFQLRTPRVICLVGSSETLTLSWQRGRWESAEVPDSAPRAVVSNLIDESFLPIEVPALRRADRASFIEVQLQGRFSQSPLRGALPYKSRAHPRRLVATGLSNAALDQTLQELLAREVPVTGVWSLSTLLMHRVAQAGRKLPASILVSLATPQGLRLLFVHDGQPLLSRLLPPQQDGDQLSRQLIATRRYLEDNRLAERQAPIPLLALDAPPGWAEPLVELGFHPLPSPWPLADPPDGLNRVLDLAHRRPAGQLAPGFVREFHQVRQIKRGLSGVTALGLAAAVIAAGHLATQLQGKRLTAQHHATTMSALQAQLRRTQADMATATLDVDLLLAAQRLQADELSLQLPLRDQLYTLAGVLQDTPELSDLRLQALGWSRVPALSACKAGSDAAGEDAAAPSAAMGAALGLPAGSGPPAEAGALPGLTAGTPATGAAADSPAAVMELRLSVAPPATDSPVLATRHRRILEDRLRAWPAAQVRTGLADASGPLVLSSSRGAGNPERSTLDYCLTVPIGPAAPAAHLARRS